MDVICIQESERDALLKRREYSFVSCSNLVVSLDSLLAKVPSGGCGAEVDSGVSRPLAVCVAVRRAGNVLLETRNRSRYEDQMEKKELNGNYYRCQETLRHLNRTHVRVGR
jgi:hypothetical protein